MAHRDNRQSILRAAEELFLSRSFDQVTLEDVRKKAKVGKGTIYLHFADKEDLYAQIILSDLDELYATVERYASGTGTADGKLLAAARAMRRFFGRRRRLMRLAQSEEFRRKMRCRSLHEDLRQRHRRIVALVAGIISAGARSGLYRNDISPPVGARMFLALAREASHAEPGRGSRPVALRRVVGLFLDGIRKR
jgi:AcrR family transcriptional regulator